MKKVFLVLALCSWSINAFTKMSPTIQSGRPGQSIGAGVVGYGIFQVQSGLDQNWLDANSDRNSQIFSNVFRLGMTKDFEISSVVNFQSDSIKNQGVDKYQSGISNFQLGFRSRIISNAEGLLPALAIQTRFKLNAIDSDYRAEHIAPIVTISTVHNLGSNTSLTHNLSLNFNGNNSTPTYFWTSNIAYSLIENWGLFFELYGHFQNNIGSIYADSGFEYFLNNDTKLDFSAGWGHNHGQKDAFVSVGISWRTALFGS